MKPITIYRNPQQIVEDVDERFAESGTVARARFKNTRICMYMCKPTEIYTCLFAQNPPSNRARR